MTHAETTCPEHWSLPPQTWARGKGTSVGNRRASGYPLPHRSMRSAQPRRLYPAPVLRETIPMLLPMTPPMTLLVPARFPCGRDNPSRFAQQISCATRGTRSASRRRLDIIGLCTDRHPEWITFPEFSMNSTEKNQRQGMFKTENRR